MLCVFFHVEIGMMDWVDLPKKQTRWITPEGQIVGRKQEKPKKDWPEGEPGGEPEGGGGSSLGKHVTCVHKKKTINNLFISSLGYRC